MLNATYYNSVFGLLLLSWVVSGCATTTHNPDPLEKLNRGVYAFNDGLDKTMLKPAAEVYETIVPEPVDSGVSNFFSNLGDIVVVVNDLLQFKFKQAASDSGRFLINSTVGLLGFVDVASELGLPKHNEDFGQTLGYWGVGSGPYLVLPFFGPSSVRDTVGLGGDTLLDPFFYYYTGTHAGTHALAPYVVKGIDQRAKLLGAEKVLQVAALDEYSYVRDAYLSRREYLVYDGTPPEKEEFDEDFFDEDDLFDEEINDLGDEENDLEPDVLDE